MGAGPAVLVTGAAGYVGRLCVEALAERRDELSSLVALDWTEVEPAQRLDGVVYEQADICSPELGHLFREHGVDTVVHLASIVRAPKGAPEDLAYRVDVLGTRNLLEACAAAQATRLIVTSSGAAYGYHPDNPDWLDENDPLRGNDEFEYAKHKRIVEDMLARWREERPELRQIVFRPGTVVGPDVHSPVTDLFEKPVILGIAGSDSPFVFIWDQDLVACLVDAVFSDKVGVYNQAGDGALTPREIAKMLKKPYLPLPASLVKAILWALKGVGLTENGPERVKFLRYRPVLSNRRLKEEYGYTPKLSSREAFELYARARGLLGSA
ncbi:MAG: SDR family oxidoreductase [Deltaproteobacteria bacterium]|nr:SDR family oxidoreductase [Deltaproteobacteria bacterium]NND29205.1 SDR family oxidoreductase [Myxococcales bacterium]MBT8482210.1 SDR family oxidoreductase [Deltaproteobacteria bacterium]NNK09178.1 SDR family oxidoreductase [Myxococcales bacterium]NNL25071.1 SDR family oxidoreductase [Myxococcales bacterium]